MEIDCRNRILSDQLSHACRFSIDCKMFGAYCYLSEIKGTVPLLHGPRGCAFFPKLVPPDAIRMKLLGLNSPPPFPCTDMDEKDVVYGGAEKLKEAILAVDRDYKPELIGVILSCPAGIIGDDIEEAVLSIKAKVNADVIYTPSTVGFADDERVEDLGRHGDDMIKLWKNPEEKPQWGIEKCGRLEALYSLIEQLVKEPAEKVENSINIDTYGRFHFFEDLDGEISEMREIFNEIGIVVNTVFPGCSVSDIKNLARAELNFMRRSERSAQLMKEKFGIDYIFDLMATHYVGLEGAKKFYLDVAGRFNLTGKAQKVISERQSLLEVSLKEIRKETKGKKVSYTVTPLFTTPQFMKLLEMLGLEIKVVFINTVWWKRFGFSGNDARKVINELKNQMKGLQSNLAVFEELNVSEEVEEIKKRDVDIAISDVLASDTSRTMFYENEGIKSVTPHFMGYSPFRISFSQIARLGKVITDRLNSNPPQHELLYLKYPRHQYRFPTMLSDLSEELRWEEIMKKVWRGKNGVR